MHVDAEQKTRTVERNVLMPHLMGHDSAEVARLTGDAVDVAASSRWRAPCAHKHCQRHAGSAGHW